MEGDGGRGTRWFLVWFSSAPHALVCPRRFAPPPPWATNASNPIELEQALWWSVAAILVPRWRRERSKNHARQEEQVKLRGRSTLSTLHPSIRVFCRYSASAVPCACSWLLTRMGLLACACSWLAWLQQRVWFGHEHHLMTCIHSSTTRVAACALNLRQELRTYSHPHLLTIPIHTPCTSGIGGSRQPWLFLLWLASVVHSCPG